jgi:hypothetical protein
MTGGAVIDYEVGEPQPPPGVLFKNGAFVPQTANFPNMRAAELLGEARCVYRLLSRGWKHQICRARKRDTRGSRTEAEKACIMY